MEISAELANKLCNELAKLNNAKTKLDFHLMQLAGQLTSDRAKIILQQGFARRLGTIHKCANNIFTIFPPSRQNLLNKDELDNLAINIQAFVINVYGAFDNLAWVCAIQNKFPEPDKNKLKISLFNNDLKPYLPKILLNYLAKDEINIWFNDYAKHYRDSTAHRIPPYIPPSSYDPKDIESINNLEKEANKALIESFDVDLHEKLKKQKTDYFKLTSVVALSLGDIDDKKPIYMHPQIVSDIMTIHELTTNFIEGINTQHNYVNLDIPSSFLDNLS